LGEIPWRKFGNADFMDPQGPLTRFQDALDEVLELDTAKPPGEFIPGGLSAI